ncbi:ATP-dependent DNA ligase [Streptomyces luteogriseus]|uniref:ATP-dependent DNA ligase n=1 Tax=Streptomyces luteogriseus TaxID=68233 RepID=UPI0036C3ACE8
MAPDTVHGQLNSACPTWDGYRAQLAVHAGGLVLLRSRQGTDMTGSFSEIQAAALAQLPADTGLDGEPVVWESERLAFERLQQRLARRGKGAVEAPGLAPNALARPGPVIAGYWPTETTPVTSVRSSRATAASVMLREVLEAMGTWAMGVSDPESGVTA